MIVWNVETDKLAGIMKPATIIISFPEDYPSGKFFVHIRRFREASDDLSKAAELLQVTPQAHGAWLYQSSMGMSGLYGAHQVKLVIEAALQANFSIVDSGELSIHPQSKEWHFCSVLPQGLYEDEAEALAKAAGRPWWNDAIDGFAYVLQPIPFDKAPVIIGILPSDADDGVRRAAREAAEKLLGILGLPHKVDWRYRSAHATPAVREAVKRLLNGEGRRVKIGCTTFRVVKVPALSGWKPDYFDYRRHLSYRTVKFEGREIYIARRKMGFYVALPSSECGE